MSVPAILIVEDEQVVALDLSRTLESIGYHIAAVADTGREAIRLAGELKPDLAIMDISLPGGLDGISAAERIQSELRIPVIFLTAHADSNTLARTAGSGAFGHLTKPVRISELNAAILIALHQHKSAREAFQRKRWLTTLLASIGEGVIATDAAGQVEFLNLKAEALTGWPLAQACGKPVEEVYRPVTPDRAALDELRIRAALRAGTALPSEQFLLPARDGHERPVEESVAPLWADDEVVGSVAVFRDLTDQLRLEEAQRLETIGVLAGGVAHDFNNLLTRIIGNASLALGELPPNSGTGELLDEVLKSGAKAAELVKQLLAYAGKGTFVKTHVDLSEAVSEIVELIKTNVPNRVRLYLKLAAGLHPVEADRSQIQQVIMNLAINACEALPDGPGLIEISTGKSGDFPRQESPRGVFLRVRDTGVGMNAETQAKIFDPFFSTKFTGRGLGLAAVHGIVRSHGGTIKVDSKPDQGTTFTVFFPAASARPDSETSGTPGRLQGDETVLVIDGAEGVRGYIKNALEMFGYSVIVAENGESALRTLEDLKSEINLVLLDMTAPGTSGDETERRIKELRPGLPICLMSGYDETVSRYRQEGTEGASCFLRKPFTPEELAANVRGALDSLQPSRFDAR